MNHSYKVAVEKLIEAKKLECDALMMFVPEKMRSHLEVISNEVKSMLIDIIFETSEDSGNGPDDSNSTTKTSKKSSKSKVKKVDIG
jgi:hypothetical protein